MKHFFTLHARRAICGAMAGALAFGMLPIGSGQAAELSRATPQTKAIPISTQTIQESGTAPSYYIEVKYPMAPAEGNNNSFNTLADERVKNLVAEFKNDLQPNDPISGTEAVTNSLYVDYKVTYNARNILSVQFTHSIYFAGAAHPNNYSSVLNYDLVANTQISLEGIFKPGSDYLDVLSTYCKRILKRRGTLDSPQGADPKPENYAKWSIQRGGITILFDPYQVAPYAAGRQECVVPVSVVRRLLVNPARW